MPVQTEYTAADNSTDVPSGYREVDTDNGEGQWVHTETGLCVDLLRYAIPTQMENAFRSRLDHYRFELVIRPDGPGTEGTVANQTKEVTYAPEMARQWMRAHPDGEV